MLRIRAIYLKIFNLMLLKRYGNSLSVGSGSRFHPSARVAINCRFRGAVTIGMRCIVLGELLNFGHGGQIIIGDDCYVGEGARLWAAKRILVGNRVLISHNVNIFDNLTHPVSAKLRQRQFADIRTIGHPKEIDLGERPVGICDDALIACGAILLRGVTVGEGSIIGAGSVVTKDVPPWTIVAGNPAKVIREIPENER
jgi:acetyltransferase-like isoleucine patch superfamily enzyme